ncbi:hypothetical protein Tco_0923768 [Tanacetum coccineum]|uniref:Uncharacterized protein n=1 Tax=Tanacetum coccineum TaxID=301880 RepID=A0ABQ5D2T6_9ASTR
MEILPVSSSSSTAVGDLRDSIRIELVLTRNPITAVEYRKASLASLNVSALDKPHFKLENPLRRFIHESNPDDADDGVTTSFQYRQTHYHMLILKLQRRTIGIKD